MRNFSLRKYKTAQLLRFLPLRENSKKRCTVVAQNPAYATAQCSHIQPTALLALAWSRNSAPKD